MSLYLYPPHSKGEAVNQEQVSGLTIREAKPEDARAMGTIYRQSWLATYPNKEAGITLQDIKAMDMDSEEATQKREENLNKPDGKSFRYVAEIDGKLVGLSGLELHPEYGYLRSIYVLPEYVSRGVGSALMHKALDTMAECPEIILGVATYNHRAIRFYEKFGFRETEPRKEVRSAPLPTGKEIPQIHMIRKKSTH